MRNELADLRKQAEALALAGEWGERAIEINTRMLELDDQAADAYTRLGRCFREQGRLDAAQEMYLQVLEFDPPNKIATNSLRRIQEALQRREAEERARRRAEENRAARAAMELRHHAAEEERARRRAEEIKTARAAAESRRQAAEERARRRAEEIQAALAAADYNELMAVGVSARKRRRYDLAVAALTRAVEMRPTSVHAWTALGALYRHSGELERAQESYRRALALGEDPVLLVALGAVERDLGNHEEAVRIYDKVLLDNPDDTFALNGIGGVYADIGKLREAEDCFKRASELADGCEQAVDGLEVLKGKYAERGDTAGVERVTQWLAHLRS